MSTKVRVILQHDGHYVEGQRAIRQLRKCDGLWGKKIDPTLKGPARIIALFENLRGGYHRDELWILREPRKMPRKKSKYIGFARYAGIGKKIYSKKDTLKAEAQIRAVARRIHGRRVQPARARQLAGRLNFPPRGRVPLQFDDLAPLQAPMPAAPGQMRWHVVQDVPRDFIRQRDEG
jgi:hypothetical protein